MFINETILNISLTCTVLFSAATTNITELSTTALFFILCITLVNGIFKHMKKDISESEKIDALYKLLVIEGLDSVEHCSNKDKCPLYIRFLKVKTDTAKKIEEAKKNEDSKHSN